jgi:hypothetical protein
VIGGDDANTVYRRLKVWIEIIMAPPPAAAAAGHL